MSTDEPTKSNTLDASLLGSAKILFEQAAVGMAQIDTATGRFLRTNQKYCEILGYSAQELQQLDFMHITHPEDLKEDLAQMELLKAGELREFSLEKRLQRKDGSLIWINLTVSPMWSAGSAPTHHIAVVEDISARKRTDAALQVLSTGLARLTGEDFFREACRCLLQILEVDLAFVGRLVKKEPPYVCSLMLWDGEQILPSMEYSVAKTPCQHVIGKEATVFSNNIQELFPEDPDLVQLGVDSYAAAPVFDVKGAPLGHVGVMGRKPLLQGSQVTSILQLFAVRIAAELERQQSESKFHDLFEFSPDAILIANQDGLITLVNRQAVALFGYQREELLGLAVERLMPEGIRRKHVRLRQKLAKESPPRPMGGRAPLFARRKDGSTFAVDISLSPMRSSDGPLVVAAIRDVTARVQAEEERLQLEAQLRQSQKMEAIGTLAGGIAHDFNNLLGVINANTSLTREELSTPHLASECLDEIEVATTRATELVRQILDFSRKQPPNQRVVSLQPLLEETSMLLRALLPAGIELKLHLGPAPDVLADAAQLQQVIMNLSTNAWHALEARAGHITIALDASNETTPDFPVGLYRGRYARITVSDSGKGIEASNLERIFEPFFTTKDIGKGSGLGLSVVHGIVQAHGGFVAVTSQPNQGTSIKVYLPASKEKAPQAVLPAMSTQPEAKGRRILFLDDEQMLVAVTQRTLSRRGYQLSGFTHPQRALEAIQRDPTYFELVITDFNMPGLSGLELIQEIKQRWPELPVMMVSGHLDDAQQEEIFEAGARLFLEKPYSTAQLIEAIHQILGEPPKLGSPR